MDEELEGGKTTNYASSLPDSIISLLGSNDNLTPSWLESVCCIIKDLQYSKSLSKSEVNMPILENIEPIGSNDLEKEVSVLKLKDQLYFLNTQLNRLIIQRRCAVNEFLDLKGNIRVFCRIRPFHHDEINFYQEPFITTGSSNLYVRITSNKTKQYEFDKVFHQQSTQEEVFAEIEPMIKSALDGYNVCIFAYGQTGSGKTYTMEGISSNPGIVPRVIGAIFEQALESTYKFEFTCSMLEIYMGNLRDLFLPQSTKLSVQKVPCLSIQMNSSGITEIENLQAVKVNNLQDVMRLYKHGTKIRSTACTNSNSTSSRSHCLTCISVTSYGEPERRRKTNKIWMVDLAGSERLLKTQASGKRLKEGKSINLSLSALGDVISALQLKKRHIPYRNSKLTQVLRDSLGSDSKTLMLVHVSPREEDVCETICSLSFASRVRSINIDNNTAPDVRAKKEDEMAELQQKIMALEIEHQDLRRNIGRLNEKLTCLTKLDTIDHPHSEVPVFYENKSQCSREDHVMKDIGDSTQKAFEMQGFMRPTICSRRRSNPGHVSSIISKKKPPIAPRNKRTSVYAESLTRDGKRSAWQSEYWSESSMSKTSFTVQSDSVDDNTECSQGNLDYDVKTLVFNEEEKSSRSSTTSLSIKSAYNRVPKIKQKENSSIDDWVHSQITAKTKTYSQNGKRVLAIPTEERREEWVKMCEQKEILSFSTINQETFSQEQGSHEGIAVDEANNSTIHAITRYSELNDEENFHQSVDGDLPVIGHHNEITEINKEIDIGRETSVQKIQARNYAENTVLTGTNSNYSESQTHDRAKEELPLELCKSNMFEKLQEPYQTSDSEENKVPITIWQKQKQGSYWELLKTLQILWASALLGLGIQMLGLSSDFFQGLTM